MRMEVSSEFDWLRLADLITEISPLTAVVLIALASIGACLFALYVVLKVVLVAKK